MCHYFLSWEEDKISVLTPFCWVVTPSAPSPGSRPSTSLRKALAVTGHALARGMAERPLAKGASAGQCGPQQGGFAHVGKAENTGSRPSRMSISEVEKQPCSALDCPDNGLYLRLSL